MKIDLAMWTLNAEKYLKVVLTSIKNGIPENKINKRILVDGGSQDKTIEIAESFKWKVYNSKKGIGRQANYALNLIETEVFASFEHDVILCKNWFNRIYETIKENDVAVSQGVRIPTNPTLKAIELYKAENTNCYSSIDNNLFKTKIIRDIGGFSEKHPYSSDFELQKRIRANGFKWLVNRNIKSIHITPSFFDRVKHENKSGLINDSPENNELKLNLKLASFSPIRGFQILLKTKNPTPFLAYPYLRLNRLNVALKTRNGLKNES